MRVVRGWRWFLAGPWMGGHWMGPPPRMGGWGFGPWGFRRRFPTREEQLEWLQAYLDDLRREARAVEERIEELKRAQPPQSPPPAPS